MQFVPLVILGIQQLTVIPFIAPKTLTDKILPHAF